MNESAYKKTKCLEFPEFMEIKLFQVFMEINKKFGATYMSYTFDISDIVRYSFRTDFKWAHVYHNETIDGKPLIESCPLDIASRERKNTFLIWDTYTHHFQEKACRDIMGMREDIGLMHGITLSTYFGAHHDAIAVATEERKNDLSTRLLLDRCGAFLKESLLKCREEVIISKQIQDEAGNGKT